MRPGTYLQRLKTLTKNPFKSLLKLSLAGLCVYITYHVLIVSYLIAAYSFVDLKKFEPEKYIPDLPFIESTKTETIAPYTTFYPTINDFGSRNLFELPEHCDNCVVLLGDSFFFGFGLNDNETVSYFLNKYDQLRRYINLASSGANVIDSVETYFSKYMSLTPPEAIIFQILFDNDIYASMHIGRQVQEEIRSKSGYILFPFNLVLTEGNLFNFYYGNIQTKIHRDMSAARLSRYILAPLGELIEKISADGVRLIVISYSTSEKYTKYNRELEKFCAGNGIEFFTPTELVDKKYRCDLLPDGHPSGSYNESLADNLVAIMGSSDTSDNSSSK